MRMVGIDGHRFFKSAPLNADWGVLGACPHLRRTDQFMLPACWDQYAPLGEAGAGRLDDGRHRSELLHAAHPGDHTAMFPQTVTPMCHADVVQPRFQFFFVACMAGSTECSDELIDCPDSADLNATWWEMMGVETIASSNVSAAREFTAPIEHMDGRTVHVIVHVWEPEGSALGPSTLVCLSRTKFDATPPELPSNVRKRRAAPSSCP